MYGGDFRRLRVEQPTGKFCAAVRGTVDDSGKIVSCVIDAVQSDINFDTAGKLITPVNAPFPTESELGAAASSGKAWSDEAALAKALSK